MGRGGERSVERRAQFLTIPDFRQGDVALRYVKRGYHVLCTHFLTLMLAPVAFTLLLELLNLAQSGQLKQIWQSASQTHVQFNLVTFCVCSLVLTCLALAYVLTRAKPVYLLDFCLYKPPDELKLTRKLFVDLSRSTGVFGEKAMLFQERIMENSGLGDETYLPPGVRCWPPDINMRSAREEAEAVIFTSVREVLAKTKLRPSQIDILIVNCSLFNPTPSLSAMVINHFKMRSNVVSYNLGGMGCSAGVIAVGLARELLQMSIQPGRMPLFPHAPVPLPQQRPRAKIKGPPLQVWKPEGAQLVTV